MPKLNDEHILARDAKRNLNEELLEAIKDMQAGQLGRVTVATRDGRRVWRLVENSLSVALPPLAGNGRSKPEG